MSRRSMDPVTAYFVFMMVLAVCVSAVVCVYLLTGGEL